MREYLLEVAEAEMPVDADAPQLEGLLGDDEKWLDAAHAFLSLRVSLVDTENAEETRLVRSVLGSFGSALDTTILLRAFAAALADLHQATYRPENRIEDEVDWQSEALASIFWTGHLVFREVTTLLGHGLATGALARSRALNELWLRARLIRAGGPDIGRRFLQHEEKRQRRLDRLARTTASGQPLDKERRRTWKALDRDLYRQYGRAFSGDYGWAHEFMLLADSRYAQAFNNGERPSGPTFNDVSIVAVEEPERFSENRRNLLYGEASLAVHGSILSALDRDAPISEVRRGPSPYDVTYAGFLAVEGLAVLTRAYVGRNPQTDRLKRLMSFFNAVTVVAEDEWQVAAEAGHEVGSDDPPV